MDMENSGTLDSPLWLQTMKNLFLQEACNGKNLVYSPLSIYTALGLLASGAKGETLNQLLAFLKSQNLDSLNGFCSEVIGSLNECRSKGQPPLSLVNSVWVDKSCVLNPKFKEVANSIFRAHVQDVDFTHKANEVRLMVNQWVEMQTSGLLKDLISEGAVDNTTMIVLVNALYFKGLWHNAQFDKSLTKKSEFYLLDGHSSVEVPYMTSTEKYQYISYENGFKVLDLPYKLQTQRSSPFDSSARRFSMYIILPDRRDGLEELIDFASTDTASFLDKYIPKYGSLVRAGEFKVPKFKITFDFDAKRVLSEMGLDLPFSSGAELTEMLSSNVPVDQVIHKCFVEVDEEGTEGFAATVISRCKASKGGPPPPPPPVADFVADHPFMFIIQDKTTGVVLFTGYVLNPLLSS